MKKSGSQAGRQAGKLKPSQLRFDEEKKCIDSEMDLASEQPMLGEVRVQEPEHG